MAVKITKYLFDTEFLPDMAHLEGENSVGWDVPPTREEVEAARAESFSAGHAAGRAEAEAESLRIQAHVLRQFAEQFVALKQSQEAILRESTKDAVAIALAVGRKLAETLVAAHPLVEIESLLAHCLSRLMGEARIVLRNSRFPVGRFAGTHRRGDQAKRLRTATSFCSGMRRSHLAIAASNGLTVVANATCRNSPAISKFQSDAWFRPGSRTHPKATPS